ncbi:hypothetical protein MANY_21610 [Mycolicibacterium anyangense]|uniref:Uncharacterized protein n=1 Tax=Mycolicibacterium anyangense TaxID=1431246 RepID=A0A6N4W9X1_9MYCO|nr:hypothetical protein [Mycolicibacterium anyangense]BBZ76824.1 hypothetical protein MANY_21610 [Mycolicibacterium anyangense]
MTSEFSRDVLAIISPLLAELGFTLDEIDDTPDEGGRPQYVVYYRSADCKIQIYNSWREGEINCMIAPADAVNRFGLRAKKWHFLGRFSEQPNLSLEQLSDLAQAELDAYPNRLEWVRDRIVRYYDDAHRGILAKYGGDQSRPMASEFSRDVLAIIGPLLAELGFTLDEIDDSPDEGGRTQHVVYYRSADCKIQIYNSWREGEINCMIAPLTAPNGFGLRTKTWHVLTKFIDVPDLPLPELAAIARAEYDAYENPLEWVRDRIARYYEAAHKGILRMYDGASS